MTTAIVLSALGLIAFGMLIGFAIDDLIARRLERKVGKKANMIEPPDFLMDQTRGNK